MDNHWAVENLQTIRTLMERSAVYRRALAPIMIFVGTVGIVGGLVGWLLPLGLFGLGGCLAKGADQQAAVSLTGSWKWYSRTFKYQ